MAAAADGPRLLSLIAVLLSTARETLQRPKQLHTAASSLHPLLPMSCHRRSAGGLLDLWVVSQCRGGWCEHSAFPFCPSLGKSPWHCPCVAPCIDAGEASHPELFWLTVVLHH